MISVCPGMWISWTSGDTLFQVSQRIVLVESGIQMQVFKFSGTSANSASLVSCALTVCWWEADVDSSQLPVLFMCGHFFLKLSGISYCNFWSLWVAFLSCYCCTSILPFKIWVSSHWQLIKVCLRAWGQMEEWHHGSHFPIFQMALSKDR